MSSAAAMTARAARIHSHAQPCRAARACCAVAYAWSRLAHAASTSHGTVMPPAVRDVGGGAAALADGEPDFAVPLPEAAWVEDTPLPEAEDTPPGVEASLVEDAGAGCTGWTGAGAGCGVVLPAVLGAVAEAAACCAAGDGEATPAAWSGEAQDAVAVWYRGTTMTPFWSRMRWKHDGIGRYGGHGAPPVLAASHWRKAVGSMPAACIP
jgi:hypothetical protein